MTPVALLTLSLACQTGPQGPEPAQAPAPAQAIDLVTALETTMADVIARAERSVVAITRIRTGDGQVTTAVRGRNGRPGDAGPRNPQVFFADDLDVRNPDFLPLPGDFGSGVVIGDKGEILTTFHVVKGASRLLVRAPGQPTFEAEIIAADPRSDLAVLVPRSQLPTPLVPMPVGDAAQLRKGSFLIVLGNPFHSARDGRASASWGILSNTTRKILPPPDSKEEVRQQFRYQPTLLQLDAKLNLGMSGGAVVNLRGELVGITTSSASVESYDAQAGYAIPMDALGRRVLDALRQGKEVEYGFLGIRITGPGLNEVGVVQPGTPAAEGDLVVGDVILAVGDQEVTEEGGLSLALSTAPVGQAVRLKVRRGNRILEKTVFLSKYPTAGEVIATNRPSPWRGLRVDFTSVLAGSTFTDSVLQAMAKGCVSIIDVRGGSPADAAGLRKGQVITAVEGQAVRSPAEFEKAVRGLEGPVRLRTDQGEVVVR